LFGQPLPATTRAPLLATLAALATAAVVLFILPPGGDLAAHLYQRGFFIKNGFAFWNNYWYAGRYSFVTYSIGFYPLAALVGIKAVSLVAVAVSTTVFAIVLTRQWGDAARWPIRAFAVIWPMILISGELPFLVGMACAISAILAVQARRFWLFTLLVLSTLLMSPLALLFLGVFAAGAALANRKAWRSAARFGAPVALCAGIEALLILLFPSGGHFPFSFVELLPVIAFCTVGLAATWRLERGKPLAGFFAVYLLANLLSFAVPSALGENVGRLRYLALPVALLVCALRFWRPRGLTVVALVLVACWNLTPLAWSLDHNVSDPTSQAGFWAATVAQLRSRLTPDYRVEVVDTAGHWGAFYLARAGIPLARGWYRQDDFPQNSVLYGRLTPNAYLHWLHQTAVRFVVLTDGPADYSAQRESALIAAHPRLLRQVVRLGGTTILEVRHPTPLIHGPGPAHVVSLGPTQARFEVAASGTYHIAIRYSPYWRAQPGCVGEAPNGDVRLTARAAGPIELVFQLGMQQFLDALNNSVGTRCSSPN
jgi:hypothetical protein